MEIPLLKDVVIILVLAMGVVYISHRLEMPAVVGLLGTGVLAGPHALGLVNAVGEVEQLAKIGVILLLFTIGIEFSLRKLMKIRGLVLFGGSFQVAATVFAVFAVTYYCLKWGFGMALFMGFLISLSSTAIVLKMLQDRAEMETRVGGIALGILIFQDIIVVLFIIVTPFLGSGTGGTENLPSVLRLSVTAVSLLVFVFIGSKYIVPVILYQTIKTRSRELFLLTLGGICFAVAFAAAELSLALGAFLAGLTISESEYSHEAFELILPFRDIFTSFFFVSIGMLLDLGFVVKHPVLIPLVTLAVMGGKSVIVAVTAIIMGYPLRTAVISGLTLGQVGEFAFILATVGSSYALLPEHVNQLFLAVSVLTMAGTGFMITAAPHIADFLMKGPVPDRLRQGLFPVRDLGSFTEKKMKDHLVIIGFGINGRHVAMAARYADIPYAVIEMNAETVRSERSKDELIYYGDATQEAVLNQVNISSARTIVIVIADAAATRRISGLCRNLNKSAHIIARTRFINEVDKLFQIGADEVIPEEFETSVEIFTRVLKKYMVPHNEIARLATGIREDNYALLRGFPDHCLFSSEGLIDRLPGMATATLSVHKNSGLDNVSIGEADFRNVTGVTILAIKRGADLITGLDASTRLLGGDRLIVIGPPDKLAIAEKKAGEESISFICDEKFRK